MKWKHVLTYPIVVALAVGFSASAKEPYRLTDPLQDTRNCIPAFSNPLFIAPAFGTTGFLLNGVGDTYTDENDLKILPWGTNVTAYCPSSVILCFVMDDDMTIDAVGTVNDPTNVSDGPGIANGVSSRNNPCWVVNGWVTRKVVTDMFKRNPLESGTTASQTGRRVGVCTGDTTAISTTQYPVNGYPCDAASDCGTGSCDTTVVATDRDPQAGGVFLATMSTLGSAVTCHVEVCR